MSEAREQHRGAAEGYMRRERAPTHRCRPWLGTVHEEDRLIPVARRHVIVVAFDGTRRHELRHVVAVCVVAVPGGSCVLLGVGRGQRVVATCGHEAEGCHRRHLVLLAHLESKRPQGACPAPRCGDRSRRRGGGWQFDRVCPHFVPTGESEPTLSFPTAHLTFPLKVRSISL